MDEWDEEMIERGRATIWLVRAGMREKESDEEREMKDGLKKNDDEIEE